MKNKKTDAPKEAEPSEIDADLDDQLAVYSGVADDIADGPLDSLIDKAYQAQKAIVAAVGSIATVAVALGWGDTELWAQIVAVVGAILTIVGVFFVPNYDAE